MKGWDLFYEVSVGEVWEKEGMEAGRKGTVVERKKELGNEEFKRGEFKRALKLYGMGVQMALECMGCKGEGGEGGGEGGGSFVKLAVALTNNIAKVSRSEG